MILTMITLNARLSSAHSLKDKRRIISGLKEKLHQKFNLSVIESDYQDSWQRIQLAMAQVAADKSFVQKTVQEIDSFLNLNYNFDEFQLEVEFY